MSNFSGFVNAGAQLGLETILIKPVKRGFFNVAMPDGTIWDEMIADATIEEIHTDELEITEHPVEQGAAIADHAFKHPAEVVLNMAWSNSPVQSGSMVNAAIGAAAASSPTANALAGVVGGVKAVGGALQQYQQNSTGVTPSNTAYALLLEMQAARALFELYTGRRHYTNMVIRSLSVQNDFKTENALFVKVTCRQVILVNTEVVTLSKDKQADATTTTQDQQKGTVNAVAYTPR